MLKRGALRATPIGGWQPPTKYTKLTLIQRVKEFQIEMTELNINQEAESYRISFLSFGSTVRLLLKELSYPECANNSKIQKPLLYKLIILSLFQDAEDLHYNSSIYKDFFDNLNDDLILYMFEVLSKRSGGRPSPKKGSPSPKKGSLSPKKGSSSPKKRSFSIC